MSLMRTGAHCFVPSFFNVQMWAANLNHAMPAICAWRRENIQLRPLTLTFCHGSLERPSVGFICLLERNQLLSCITHYWFGVFCRTQIHLILGGFGANLQRKNRGWRRDRS
jgi:hypothetical protein